MDTKTAISAPPLDIRLFGPFEVRVHGRPLPPLRSRKGRWLLSLLVLRGGQEVERSWLSGTLWPDTSEPQSRASLRQSLTDLRTALGEEAGRIEPVTPHTLRLDLQGAVVDVLPFDRLSASADPAELERAMELYRGPLLEGCSEEWVFQERARREQAFLGCLERLARVAMAAGEPERAARLLRQGAAADPFGESLHRGLMEALASTGNYSAALMEYRELRLRLHRELNTQPDPETVALFERIRAEARRRAESGGTAASMSARPARPEPGEAPSPATGVAEPPADARAPEEPRAARTPRARPAPPSNLPRPLTHFIGREREVREIRASLEAARLVTLTGPGGVGKTRLAIEVAESLAGETADGCSFVDLTTLTDPRLVPGAVAAALGLREQTGRTLTEVLADYLRLRAMLLVLDNCEHLLDAASRLIARLLEGCPSLSILATSRQVLGVSGEVVRTVRPLELPPLPAGQERPQPAGGESSQLLDYPAIRLFVDRADASAEFVLTDRNAASVVQICRRLDGIPLALELAAARVKLLSVEQLANRLDDRFRVLTSGSRTALPRQQTLQALLDWSYDLLSEPERALLRWISVFRGGFTLESAECLCRSMSGMGVWECGSVGAVSDDGTYTPTPPHTHTRIPFEQALELLAQLVDKSLVQVESTSAGDEPTARYRLLETTRAYAAALLEQSGELDEIREAHARYYLDLAERAAAELEGPQVASWGDLLEAAHDDLRAALDWLLSPQRSHGPGVRLVLALAFFWRIRGHLTEARRRLTAALQVTRGAERSDETEARRQLARLLGAAGLLALDQSDLAAAEPLLEESRAVWEELGDTANLGGALTRLGKLAEQHFDTARAREYYERTLALSHQTGSVRGMVMALNNLGGVACGQGDYAASRAFHQQCLELNRQLGNVGGVAWALTNLGETALAEGHAEEAQRLFLEAMALFREMRSQRGIINTLDSLARAAQRQGGRENAMLAVRLLGAAGIMREGIQYPVSPMEWPQHTLRLEALRASLGESRFHDAWQEGAAAPLESLLPKPPDRSPATRTPDTAPTLSHQTP